jgi:CO/xanthine dehydrogenase FAD-binding subunit
MMPTFDVHVPVSLSEACGLLRRADGTARIIAGGTDLIIGLRNGSIRPACLVDVTQIAEMTTIEEKGEQIVVGAAVTHATIGASPLARCYAKALSEAASVMGSPQIRNLGTIGGNIVNACPAADTLPALMVLDATARVVSPVEEKELPVCDLVSGPYRTMLQPYEIVTHIRFRKLQPGARTGFVRLARREGMAIARMSIAVIVVRDTHGRIEDVRISTGALMPTPQRVAEVEAVLRGKVPDGKLLELAARRLSQVVLTQTGIRPSTSYKKPVVEALFVRAMCEALGESYEIGRAVCSEN